MSHRFSRISTDQDQGLRVNLLVMDATEVEVGLLLNFGLSPHFRRLLFDNDRKKIRENPCESVAKASA